MAYDLGDPIPLIFKTVDAAGAPVNVTAATLTVTLPDGTSVAPAVGLPSPVGTYAPSTPYVSSQAGIHRVSWVGTGTSAQAYSDVFNVLASDPRFLISLADARLGIGVTAANTMKDEDLRTYIAAATPIMEDIVGPILRATHVETYDGGAPSIALLWAPMISVSSVVESYGSTVRYTLNPVDVFSGGGTDAYGYTVDLGSGLMTRRAAGVAIPFAAGRRNVQVTYISGRTSVTANVLLATRRLIRHLWQSEQQGFRPPMSGPDALTKTPSGFAVPFAVIEMCAAATRAPGLA